MATFESNVKHLAYAPESVYAKLSDLSNLANVKQRLGGEEIDPRIAEKIGEDKANEIREKLSKIDANADEVSIDVPPVGKIALKVVERVPNKSVKLASENSMLPVEFTININPEGEGASTMQLALDANLNPFLKMMLGQKLKEGVDKMADMLAMLPYGTPAAERADETASETTEENA